MGATKKQRELKAQRAAARAERDAQEAAETKRQARAVLDALAQAEAASRAHRQVIETAAKIAHSLDESDVGPCREILASVRLLGPDAAWALLLRTVEIEKHGGMLVASGFRYRTPGGVYFALLRELLTPAQWAAVGGEEGEASQ